jgi:hypothetical protein
VTAGSIVAYFCVHPYLLSLVDWRNAMTEEAEALLHSSKKMNKILKSLMALSLILIISTIEWGCLHACSSGLEDIEYWIGLSFDSMSATICMVLLAVYSKLSFQAVQILGSLPFLLIIFLNTIFSPGAGVSVIKELRYIFPRFYLWCILPGVMDQIEDCPPENLNTLCLILSSFTSTLRKARARTIVRKSWGWKKLRSSRLN